MSVLRRNMSIAPAMSLICLVLPLLLSCSTFGDKKNDDKSLVEHIEAFNSALRWEDFKIAASVIPPQSQEEFWRLADKMQGRVRIMDFQIRNVSMEPGSQSWTAILRFRYYYTDDPHVRTKTLRQRWRFLEKEEVWQLVQFDLMELMPERP